MGKSWGKPWEMVRVLRVPGMWYRYSVYPASLSPLAPPLPQKHAAAGPRACLAAACVQLLHGGEADVSPHADDAAAGQLLLRAVRPAALAAALRAPSLRCGRCCPRCPLLWLHSRFRGCWCAAR